MSKNIPHIFKWLSAFVPPILWAVFIYFLSAQQVLPGLALDTWDFLFKKTAHMFVYAVLFLLLFRGFKMVGGLKGYWVWLLPLILTIAYAAADEIHQALIPGRHATLRDIGFDTLGASLVLMQKFGYI